MGQNPLALKNGTEKLQELEGLRGLLAWWVVVAHAYAVSGLQGIRPLPLFLQPELAVEVFMILSGFVIFMVLDRGETAKDFYLRRFFRIYPVYLAALLLGTVLWLALPELVVDPLMEGSNTVRANLGAHLGAHAAMVHGMIPDEVLPCGALALLPPGWSLSLEFQFYALAPLLFVFCRRPTVWAIGVMAAVLAARILAHCYKNEVTFGMVAFFPLRVEYFMAGALSFFIWKQVRRAERPPAAGWPLLFLAPLLFLLTRSIPIALWAAVLAVLLAGRTDSLVWPLKAARWFLVSPLLQRLGKWSYSTYCLHWPVFMLAAWMLFSGREEWTPGMKFPCLLAVGGGITLLVSWLSFEKIEMHGIRCGRRLTRGAGAA